MVIKPDGDQAGVEASDASELALLHRKVDRLTELLEAQERRYQELEELKNDAIPIVNHAIKLSIAELAEIGTEFKLEDLLFLLKRLLRSTPMLLKMLDQLEALSELQQEGQILGKQVFHTAVEQLDRMEREGYFAFARGGLYITEQIVREFSEEDVRALGDNIVTILKTVRSMTQPEIMALANNAVEAIREEEPVAENVSTLALIRELGDPKVRKGMVRLLHMVKALADQPDAPPTN
jgi:uncharacterized protein YjgD (DUF1641 family)